MGGRRASACEGARLCGAHPVHEAMGGEAQHRGLEAHDGEARGQHLDDELVRTLSRQQVLGPRAAERRRALRVGVSRRLAIRRWRVGRTVAVGVAGGALGGCGGSSGGLDVLVRRAAGLLATRRHLLVEVNFAQLLQRLRREGARAARDRLLDDRLLEALDVAPQPLLDDLFRRGDVALAHEQKVAVVA